VVYGVTSLQANRNTITKASRRGVTTSTTTSLARYRKSIQNIIKNLKVELDVPIALMGDFNIDMSDDKNELAEFLA
jgi:Holliday junction resolvase RusA-like endonuclease